jgi:DNA-binding NtrC family response regulator
VGLSPDGAAGSEAMQQSTGESLAHGADLRTLLASYERQLIQAALAATAGNQRRAARALGLLPTTLHEKMKRLGLRRPTRRSVEAGSSEPEVAQQPS